MEGGDGGVATINVSLIEGSQNGRSAVCVLTTNQMTLNTTIRVKKFTFKNSFLISRSHSVYVTNYILLLRISDRAFWCTYVIRTNKMNTYFINDLIQLHCSRHVSNGQVLVFKNTCTIHAVLWYFVMHPYKQSSRCQDVFDTNTS